MAAGTPSILSLSALDTALDVWDGVDINLVRAKSVALCELFIAEVERQCKDYGLRLAGPRESALRGSQVSFHCAAGYEVMRALIAEGVIGDFRAPDIIRFGMTPLYLRYRDVADAAAVIARVFRDELWKNPAFKKRAKVT
jgi:kynureninase